MKNKDNESINRLFQVIAKMDNPDECRAFFDDICTIQEIQDMAKRFDIVVLLDKKENYLDISEKIGVSSATISRVNRCLLYGDGGYRSALEKWKEISNDNK